MKKKIGLQRKFAQHRLRGKDAGFTLIELITVMGIIALLLGFVTLSLANVRRTASVNAEVSILVSDMKTQQVKAMSGAGGVAGENFGIYFQSDKYILFNGSSYSPSNTSNFSVSLPSDLEFYGSSFPGNTIVFLNQSGEVSGFVNGNNSITLKSIQGNESKTVTINRYGVVTGIN